MAIKKLNKKRVSEGIAHIHASFNNTLISITDNRVMLLHNLAQEPKVLGVQERVHLLLHRKLLKL